MTKSKQPLKETKELDDMGFGELDGSQLDGSLSSTRRSTRPERRVSQFQVTVEANVQALIDEFWAEGYDVTPVGIDRQGHYALIFEDRRHAGR